MYIHMYMHVHVYPEVYMYMYVLKCASCGVYPEVCVLNVCPDVYPEVCHTCVS